MALYPFQANRWSHPVTSGVTMFRFTCPFDNLVISQLSMYRTATLGTNITFVLKVNGVAVGTFDFTSGENEELFTGLDIDPLMQGDIVEFVTGSHFSAGLSAVEYTFQVLLDDGEGPTNTTSIHGLPIASPPYSAGDALIYNGTQWQKTSLRRKEVVLVTPTISAGATYDGEITMARSYQLLNIEVSHQCRLRIYQTDAARTADASRPIETLPAVGTQHGVVLDLLLDSETGLDWKVQDGVSGSNMEDVVTADIPFAIENTDGVSHAITITITYLVKEH